MTRPKSNNRLSVDAGKWYYAGELIPLGWSGMCCKDGLTELLLAGTYQTSGLSGLEREQVKPKEDPKNLYRRVGISEVWRFRFKSRGWAKAIRKFLVVAEAESRLSGSHVRCVCEEVSEEDLWP